MAQNVVNGYTVVAHRPSGREFVRILASVPRVSGGYEYVVATMRDVTDSHWSSGYYTANLVNAVNEYYQGGV